MITISESGFGFPSNATPNIAGPTPPNSLKRKSSNELTNEGIAAAYITYQQDGDVPQYLTLGCLAFIETPTRIGGIQTRASPIHSIRSLAGMNAWLYNDAKLKHSSGVDLEEYSQDILDRFCLLGVVDNPDYTSRRAGQEKKRVDLVNVVVGRGAMCHNYWAGDFSKLLPNATDKTEAPINFEKGMHLWLLLVVVDCDELAEGDEHGTTPDFAWQFVPYVTKSRRIPSRDTYNTADFSGNAVYVGKTLSARGSFLHKDTFRGIIQQNILRRSSHVPSGGIVSRIPLCEICLS